MKKKLFFTLAFIMVLFLMPQSVNAQYNSPASNVYVGGSFGLQFGTEDIIDVSPMIGFWVTPFFTIGTGLSYQYYSTTINNLDYTDHIYGARVFGRLYFLDMFYLHSEYEYLSLKEINAGSNVQRFNQTNLLVGGGYREWVGPNMFMSFTVLWNLNDKYNNASDKPIYRVGFGVAI
ncbi:MAG: hypothetical protein CL663_04610 [Bacteroidetes bacterium]|nr:hypothetical protein [Bacteroidota bacterium]